MGSAVHTILRERLPWRAFADPASAALAVEELLRFDGPVQVNSRVALDDASFAGGRVRRGDVLLLLLGSANRDPDGFARPDEIDLHRQPNKHLAFGHGIHQCLGAALARRILRIALARLTESLPDLALAGAVEHKPQATQRCLHRLPVACAGSRTAAAPGIA
jgi:cytochrome P450